MSRVGQADLIKFGEPAEDKQAKALLNAVLKNNLTQVRQLLRKGSTPTAETLSNAIGKAAWSGNHDILKALLKRMAHQRIPLRPSVVRVALSKGHKNPSRRIQVIKLLLAAGADINGEGGEALRTAMRQEDAALVKFLLEAGADVNAANEHGSTPLHYAAFLGPSLPNCSSKPAPGLTPKIATAKPPPSWQPSMGAKRCQRSSSKRPSHESGMFTRC